METVRATFEYFFSTGEDLASFGEKLVIVAHPFVIALDAFEWSRRGLRYVASKVTARFRRPIESPAIQSAQPTGPAVASAPSEYEVHVIRDRFGDPYLLLLVTSQLIYVIYVTR
ncbi:hypothetical protein [Streptomyces sp. NPDC058305]|uniref:hypothetical protein n=1 Tax=Streptomyces sp. NPDC058305 TaxID=3346438 RepID=UPI0036EBF217